MAQEARRLPTAPAPAHSQHQGVDVEWHLGPVAQGCVDPCHIAFRVDRDPHLERAQSLPARTQRRLDPFELGLSIATLGLTIATLERSDRPVAKTDAHAFQAAGLLVAGEGGSSRHGRRV